MRFEREARRIGIYITASGEITRAGADFRRGYFEKLKTATRNQRAQVIKSALSQLPLSDL